MSLKTLSTQQIMNRIYKDIDGFEIPKDDEQHVRKSKGSPIYGEINYQSLNKLLTHLKLTSNDVLYDLGSGVGKVVIQAALASPVRSSVGVELSTARYQDALLALDNGASWDKKIHERCKFINADMLTVDLSSATVVYTCSTAFSLGFMKKVTDYLASFKHKFRLVTLQELPDSRHFELVDRIKLNMSWVRNTSVYMYRR
jgi:hypothetical protein